jgi:hypothetical protein
MGGRMGRLRVAFEGFGRSLTALFSRSREPGPVADVEVGAAGSGGVGGGGGAAASGAAGSGPGATVAGEPAPSFRNRARLRRRLRYLRQTRELGFRDLGGFLFDSKRFGRDRDDIVQAKLEGLNAIDLELRALELALDDAQEVTLLREPGISVCPRCGALHGSEDNYCPACGLPVGRGLGLAVAQGGPGGAVRVAPSAGAPTSTPPAADAAGAPASTPPGADAAGAPGSTPPTAPAAADEDEAAGAPTSETSSVAKP